MVTIQSLERSTRTRGRPVDPVHIRASYADIAEMELLLRRGARTGNETAERNPHLGELIPKPWGEEYRVYADDFLDVWHLRIDPGHSTSMHAHPRKTTYMICLDGVGVTRTLSGEIPLSRGTILCIGRGAFHSTENASRTHSLALVEVENPRNKYDLVRLRDAYARTGQGYENVSAAMAVQSRPVACLPNGRMRTGSPCGAYSFTIVSGTDIYYRRRLVGTYLIPLGVVGVISDRVEILTDDPDDTRPPELDQYYLSIRRLD